ncbi:MAG: S-adenosyl-l-methionine hydroxide adenosyltransferase family protein [Ilumatobacteraceae bacterium]
MGRRYDTISFLSDFGVRDELVGVVKSVVRDLAPHATVIDLTHGVAAFDIRAGSLALARAIPYVASGIVLAVVDPGVGTARRAVAIEVGGGEGVLVGPDNGLLAPAVAIAGGAERAVVLTNESYQLAAPGPTFAGRDVFAPAAAHLCNGVDLFELGEPVDPDVLVPGVVPLPRDDAGSIVCEVLWVDRFGNCQLNVGPDEVESLGSRVQVSVGDLSGDPVVRVAARAVTFDDIGTGSVGLVTDSSGMLALALARRSAADELGLAAGDQVLLSSLGERDSGAIAVPVRLGSPSPGSAPVA